MCVCVCLAPASNQMLRILLLLTNTIYVGGFHVDDCCFMYSYIICVFYYCTTQNPCSLDRLEEEEKARIHQLKLQVLPENVPDPIGIDDAKRFALNAQQSSSVTTTDSAAVLLLGGPPLQPSSSIAGAAAATVTSTQSNLFWHKYKSQQQQLLGRFTKPASTALKSGHEGNDLMRTNAKQQSPPPSSSSSTHPYVSSSSSKSLHYGGRLRLYRENMQTTPPNLEPVTLQTKLIPLSGAAIGKGTGTTTAVSTSATAAASAPPPRSMQSPTSRTASTSSRSTITGRTRPSNRNSTNNSMMSFSHDDDTTFDQDFDDDDDDEDMVDD